MPPPPPLLTPRLTLTPLAAEQLAAFHALVTDPHIRRYMMDGEVLPLEWSAGQIAASTARFQAGSVGLWLAHLRERAGDAIGFCGFTALPGTELANELVYALRQDSSGAGLATEMAGAMIAHARAQPGFGPISASVDAVNAASVRTLEKLGFRRTGTRPGAFGDMLLFEL
jgi:[ribosomal protein S5]-alanine N-acetyltransferase